MVKIGDIKISEFPLLLAPMEDVSDPPFRIACKENGADLMFTEFISSEGLIRNATKSIAKLDIFEYEHPIGIQIFGNEMESMRQATEIAEQAGPDIIDINYGCPVKKVASKGAGAGILKDIPKMVQMTAEIVKVASLPVTVKTRLGWDHNTMYIVEVAERLQDIGIKAISIHGRTRKQMYKGSADWELIGQIKDNPRMIIPVFGNGDIDSPQKADEMRRKYGVDGIMIGRASIGYPWIFNEIKDYLSTGKLRPPPSVEERIQVLMRHLDFSIRWKGARLGILEMRRHYKNYFKGIPHMKEFRIRLQTCNYLEGIHQIIEEIKNHVNQTGWVSNRLAS
ncbi:MAG: tRNA dihydrouridine synthase DusB [Candidatus Poribacteria bacterium]|nr:tRNA dihydrouridine synthase DusB [Candidatus Poribacteria bacterium]